MSRARSASFAEALKMAGQPTSDQDDNGNECAEAHEDCDPSVPVLAPFRVLRDAHGPLVELNRQTPFCSVFGRAEA